MIRTTRPEPAKLGLGYRELKVGETIQEGDEFATLDQWIAAVSIGCHIKEQSVRHRRKIEQEGKRAA